jgi:hypothetical protein
VNIVRARAAISSPASLELALFDPQILRELRIVSTNILDEPLSILAADEDLEGITWRSRDGR